MEEKKLVQFNKYIPKDTSDIVAEDVLGSCYLDDKYPKENDC